MRGPLGVTSVLLALFAFAVSADTWVPPSVRHYPSATGDHVFIVEPNLMPGADGVVPKGRLVTASGASRWWAGEHSFESPQVLALKVFAEGSDILSKQPKFDVVRVRLQDGAVLP